MLELARAQALFARKANTAWKQVCTATYSSSSSSLYGGAFSLDSTPNSYYFFFACFVLDNKMPFTRT